MRLRTNIDRNTCENLHLLLSATAACENVHLLERPYYLSILFLIPILALSLLFVTPISAQPLISVPADYLRDLQLPGATDHFLRPARILADHAAGEIYVADTGNDRVVILDQNGLFKFKFSVSEQCGAPIDIAVNSRGQIFVLGTTRSGYGIFQFDFNGNFLRSVVSDSLLASVKISGIAIDSRDRLHALDEREKRLLRLTDEGQVEIEFPATADLDSTRLRDAVYGSFTIHDDIIYLPVSSLGTVYCLDLNGRKIRQIGYFGTQAGELNFPVAVAVMPEGSILVLDKHRYNVSCYSGDGQYLGEFGGKGVNSGWFYHPGQLAVDNAGLIYVGQIFNNKIQVCRLPESIRERQKNLESHKNTRENSNTDSGIQIGQIQHTRSRKTFFAAINNHQHNGGILHA